MAPESSTLKKGSRVVVITDIPGVAAGTTGRVGRAIGVKTTRYRVKFDNGVDALSVAEGKLVSPAAWEFLKQSQTDGSKITHDGFAAVPGVPQSVRHPSSRLPGSASTSHETCPPAPQKPEPAPSSDSGSSSDDPSRGALPSREARRLWAASMRRQLCTRAGTRVQQEPRKSRLRVKRRWRAAQQP